MTTTLPTHTPSRLPHTHLLGVDHMKRRGNWLIVRGRRCQWNGTARCFRGSHGASWNLLKMASLLIAINCLLFAICFTNGKSRLRIRALEWN
jgi:hypothetical protein